MPQPARIDDATPQARAAQRERDLDVDVANRERFVQRMVQHDGPLAEQAGGQERDGDGFEAEEERVAGVGEGEEEDVAGGEHGDSEDDECVARGLEVGLLGVEEDGGQDEGAPDEPCREDGEEFVGPGQPVAGHVEFAEGDGAVRRVG